MLTVLLMIYLGMQLNVPAWYYIICVLMMIIQAVKLGIEIQKSIEKNGLNGLMSIHIKGILRGRYDKWMKKKRLIWMIWMMSFGKKSFFLRYCILPVSMDREHFGW